MNLVKWFRKNNTKVMAVVVIIIMIGFIGGSALPSLLRRGQGLHKPVAYFGQDGKMSRYELNVAEAELKLLATLQADELLRWQDLHGVLLGELLFSEQRTSPALIDQVKRAIAQNQYRISYKQIDDLYRRQVPPKVYWLLLQAEAQRAGIRVPKENAGELLGRAIPRLFNGQTYARIIGSIVKRRGIPEEQILTTLAKLLAVLQYSHTVCSNQDVTARQIMQEASLEQEGIDVDLVKFDSDVFAKTQEQPIEEQMAEHFDRYKKFPAGFVGEENPYGFGYKLPDRVQLEYIAVRLDDIRGIVTPPTRDEMVDYYNKQKERLFTEQISSDPNDPNAPSMKVTKGYAEVADAISRQLLRQKVSTTADRIIQEAKTLTEAFLEDTEIEPASLTGEQLKAMAGDYETVAEQLIARHTTLLFELALEHQSDLEGGTVTEALRQAFEDRKRPLSQEASLSVEEAGSKWLIADAGKTYPVRKEKDKLNVYYRIRVYVGQTGLLSAANMQMDEHLAALYVQGYTKIPVGLTQVVFAVDELAASELGPFDLPKPRMYENIGPVQDMVGRIVLLIRVIQAQKAAEPEGLNHIFSTSSLQFDPNEQKADEEVYSVKEKVAEDLKRLAAMDLTKSKAQEFIDLAAKDDWDSALAQFNTLYGQQAKEQPDDPNVFRLQNISDLRRISRAALETLSVQSQGDPVAPFFLNDRKKQRQFVNQLYSLVPQDSNSVDDLPVVMEFKPDMSYYVIKNISIRRLWKEQYEQIKAQRLYQEDHVQSQSLAAVHFNPENILKRMDFRAAGADQQAQDANVPAESEAAS
ncbi:MAG: hypothetical protein AMJ75_06710 [Phycisphaerae bacterium SM1_79]|nr:MAG: hypothetical protein AMJ75_06710 [Phycisphaerae bacterium SM1_79]